MPPNREDPDRPRPVLPYGRPDSWEQRVGQGRVPVAGRIALGCFGYLVLGTMWFFATARMMFLPWRLRILGWICITIGLLGLTLWLRLQYRIRGYGYGILVLLGGLVLLILWTCGNGRI